MSDAAEFDVSANELALDALAERVLSQRPGDADPEWDEWSRTHLDAFFRRAEHHEFRSFDRTQLHYCVLAHPKPKAWVLVSPGRVESYLKYQEVALELVAAGFAVAMIDHRGQGHSERLTSHHEQGHVNQFADYAHDFEQWVQELRPRLGDLAVHILAHSMGGAIATMYVQSKPHEIQSLVLSAPMFGINTTPWPQWFAGPLTRSLTALNRLVTPGKFWYAPGTGDYQKLPFAENKLTHSEARYEHFSRMYADMPNIKVGGPTTHWVTEALEAAEQCIQSANKITIPVLVLSGTADRIVDPRGHQRFAEKLTHERSQLKEIPDSYHEILMESDARRAMAITAALTFFEETR
ncbi:alpha/beta fold hydrolase [Aliidiomarina halalkaliphila]|uniref:Alpha/beta fold hydrolase n=1 Tax=Aliidiomarina halalkaliphila TaxID=2593535 RepID=A0A552WZU2_9GAMM|nr:alpha/beta fold hydrolase [Aliidiomarina halalkaliphila]TRW48342.1 alpha/beta fold hydrolase [Aliidiomarina halalkaliphila]